MSSPTKPNPREGFTLKRQDITMQFFLGVICGMLLMVIVAFIANSLATADEPGTQPQRIVNWDLAGESLNRSIETIRGRLHKLTR